MKLLIQFRESIPFYKNIFYRVFSRPLSVISILPFQFPPEAMEKAFVRNRAKVKFEAERERREREREETLCVTQ